MSVTAMMRSYAFRVTQSLNRDVYLIVIGVLRLDGQGQIAGALQTLGQRHVELVQSRKSGGLPFEEDRRLLAADVDYDVGIRAVERGGIARRAVGQSVGVTVPSPVR